MAAPYLLSSSSVVPGTPEAAYDAVLAAPLQELFTSRAGVIPPIQEMRGQEGPWATVGQTRTIVLADGGTNLETLVTADRAGGDYRYRLSDFTGAMKPLVASVNGRFTFVAEGSATRATWSWELFPTNPVARLMMPVLGFFWGKYADSMWPRLAARISA